MKTICEAVSAHILLGLGLKEELTPIEQLPEGLIVLLKCGYSRFYGYRLGEKFYHQNHEEHTRVLSPSEFRRLTGYEKTIMGRGETS